MCTQRIFIGYILIMLCSAFSCTTKYDKHPKDVKGTITSFTKNGISRMVTINKYFSGNVIEIGFGQSMSGTMTSRVYPFYCKTKYWINGVAFSDVPSYTDQCPVTSQYNLIKSPDEIYWYCYSFQESRFVSLVDGGNPCFCIKWDFTRVGKKGHFNLRHTTPSGDIYKLEFR